MGQADRRRDDPLRRGWLYGKSESGKRAGYGQSYYDKYAEKGNDETMENVDNVVKLLIFEL